MYEVVFQPTISVTTDAGVIESVGVDFMDSLSHVYDMEVDDAVQATEGEALLARNLACQLLDDGQFRTGLAALLNQRMTELGLG